MNFRDQIRQMYQKEVQPTFEEDRWKQFMDYRKAKKKPRRKWAIYLLLFLLVLATGLARIAKYGHNRDGVERNSSHVTSPERLPEVHKPALDSPLNQEIEKVNQPVTPGFSISADPAPNESEPSITSAEVPHPDDRLVTERSSDHISARNDFRLEQALMRLSSRPTDPLSFERNLINGNPADNSTSGASTIRVRSTVSWPKHLYTIQAYGGLTFPSHLETVEEQAYQFGSSIYRRLSNRLRAKLNLHFASATFTTIVMNPRLGVEYVESPSDRVQFDHSIVESINSNLNLGLDLLFWKTGDLYIYGGVAYGFSKELVKDIDYVFNGQDLDIDDDIYLSKSDSKKYFIPHIIRLESGVQYQNELGGIVLSFDYPIQLSTTRIEMLHQWQINFGLLRQL